MPTSCGTTCLEDFFSIPLSVFFFFSWKLVVRSILEFRIFYWNISYADMYFLWFHYKRLIISFCLTLRDAEMQRILMLPASRIHYIRPFLPFTYGFSIHWWPLPRSIVSWGCCKIVLSCFYHSFCFNFWNSSIKIRFLKLFVVTWNLLHTHTHTQKTA